MANSDWSTIVICRPVFSKHDTTSTRGARKFIASKYAVFSFSNDNFIMETEESIEIADLHARFNAYGSTIDAEGEEEEEMVEDEEVDVDSNCRNYFL